MNLSVPQRELIRAIADKESLQGTFSQSTFASLQRRGLIILHEGAGIPEHEAGWYLTEAGETAYHRIMKSGDGPEGLKDLFRL